MIVQQDAPFYLESVQNVVAAGERHTVIVGEEKFYSGLAALATS